MSQQQYDNNLRGVLFKNDKKTEDKHPNMRGQCEIDGVEYWVSAWTKESPQKGRYQTLAFTPKEERPKIVTPQRRSVADEPDDIPW